MNPTLPIADSSPASTPASRRVSPWWRLLAVSLLLALLLGWAASASMLVQLRAQIGHLQERLIEQPQVRHIALLLDDRQLPALLVTFAPKQGALLLQRLSEVQEGRQDSMQLWALTEGQPPRSLGVIESRYKTLQLPATEDALNGATELAISVENKGGVPQAQGPRLPWLFKGWLVQKSI